VRALDGVDVDVEAGEAIALLGRSGSGKTTLLHVLGGLVRPSSGMLTRRTDRIGFVFQGSNLLAHFTAFENLAFAAQVADRKVDTALAPQVLLELVGLAAKAESLPSELSGGEQQRVAIARALAQAPQLLLCDEPTGHLDSDTGERLLELIDALERELGFALVIATHDAGVACHARRSIVLVDGVAMSESAPA
jgi:putative ABC transport system ATP-binding protein